MFMPTQEQYIKAIKQFVKKYYHKFVDIDGVHGSQCWDLNHACWRWTLRQLVGTPDYWLLTGNGRAWGAWEKFTGRALNTYFTKVPHGSEPYRYGDYIVWPADFGGLRVPDGHIAIFLKYDSMGNMVVFQQDGAIDRKGKDGKAGKDGLADGVAHYHTWILPRFTPYGALRFKTSDGGQSSPAPQIDTLSPPVKSLPIYSVSVPIVPQTFYLRKDTKLWNLNFARWGTEQGISYPEGTEFTSARMATHSLGGRYHVPSSVEGKPVNHLPHPAPDYGFNAMDCQLSIIPDPVLDTDQAELDQLRGQVKQPPPKPKLRDKPNTSTLDPIINLIVNILSKMFGGKR